MVQTVKSILKKCEEEGDDPYVGLLSYRATPVDHHLKSPAELLNSRKFRTTLPMSQRACYNQNSDQVKETLYQRHNKQGYFYNRKAGPSLRELQPGEPIRIHDHRSHTWQRGSVVKTAEQPRAYIVLNDETGAVLCRTRSHLAADHSAVVQQREPQPASTVSNQPSQARYRTRSRRLLKAPERLNL